MPKARLSGCVGNPIRSRRKFRLLPCRTYQEHDLGSSEQIPGRKIPRLSSRVRLKRATAGSEVAPAGPARNSQGTHFRRQPHDCRGQFPIGPMPERTQGIRRSVVVRLIERTRGDLIAQKSLHFLAANIVHDIGKLAAVVHRSKNDFRIAAIALRRRNAKMIKIFRCIRFLHRGADRTTKSFRRLSSRDIASREG